MSFDTRAEAHGWFWHPCPDGRCGGNCDDLVATLQRAYDAGLAAARAEVERLTDEFAESSLVVAQTASDAVKEAHAERDALRARVTQLEAPLISLEDETANPVVCSKCGHQGTLKVSVSNWIAGRLSALVKEEGERVDAEWAEKVEAAKKQMEDGSAILVDAQAAIDEASVLRARLVKAELHVAALAVAIEEAACIKCNGQDDEHVTEDCEGDGEDDSAHILGGAAADARAFLAAGATSRETP